MFKANWWVTIKSSSLIRLKCLLVPGAFYLLKTSNHRSVHFFIFDALVCRHILHTHAVI